MLINCPECNKQISDKAVSCPNCGYPVPESIIHFEPQPIREKAQPKRKKSSRMRLPNGFGRITEIKGRNLRKPFRAMISDGVDDNGRPIGRLLKPEAYFETYNDAYQALMKYHENPYDYQNTITVDELYEKWAPIQATKVTLGSMKNITSAYNYLDPIKDMEVRAVGKKNIRELFDDLHRINRNGKKVEATTAQKTLVKNLLYGLFDYAADTDIIESNFIRTMNIYIGKPESKNPHEVFSEKDFKAIYENRFLTLSLKLATVQCYTGMRPEELLNIKTSDVNMKDWVMTGGMKTEAGKDRRIPIHTKIRDVIQDSYNKAIANGCDYLFSNGKEKIQYSWYRYAFIKDSKDIGIAQHKLHDCRKTFITRAKESGMDPFAIKLIVGHSIRDITESTYTERSLSWLHKELSKMK